MSSKRLVLVVALSVCAVPGVARADVPWSSPLAVGAVSSPTVLVSTEIAQVLVAGASVGSTPATTVSRVREDGTLSHPQTLPIAYTQVARYERGGVVVAGSAPSSGTASAERAPVVVGLGSVRGVHGVDRLHRLGGTGGQWVAAVGGNPANGVVAVLTAAMYQPGTTRELWVRHGKVFKRALRFTAGTRARDAAVAVGPRGDVLVAWQGHRVVYARHLGPTGHPGPVHRLGAGIQSSIQARVDDDGRLEVAWESQQVGEGNYAHSPAVVSYTSAAAGAAFTSARVVGGSSASRPGDYVMRPGVRLVATGATTSALAWTGYGAGRFDVRVADVTAGHVGDAQIVSSPDESAMLADLASSPAGGQLVTWLSAASGNPGSGPRRIVAASREPAAKAYEPPTTVAAGQAFLPVAPTTSLDQRTGRGFVVWPAAGQAVLLSTKPPSS